MQQDNAYISKGKELTRKQIDNYQKDQAPEITTINKDLGWEYKWELIISGRAEQHLPKLGGIKDANHKAIRVPRHSPGGRNKSAALAWEHT